MGKKQQKKLVWRKNNWGAEISYKLRWPGHFLLILGAVIAEIIIFVLGGWISKKSPMYRDNLLFRPSRKSAGAAHELDFGGSDVGKSLINSSKIKKMPTIVSRDFVWWGVGGVCLIIIGWQIPKFVENYQIFSERAGQIEVVVLEEENYLALPGDLNFSEAEMVALELDEVLSEVVLTANTTETEMTSYAQKERLNWALAAFYKADWVNYQNWLNQAKEMDPNESYF